MGLSREQWKALLINLASSAIAMNTGESFLVPSSSPGSQAPLVALLAFTGCTGVISVMLPQRSFTSVAQLVSYGIAIAALGYFLDDPTERLPNDDLLEAVPLLEREEASISTQNKRLSASSPIRCCTAALKRVTLSLDTSSQIVDRYLQAFLVATVSATWVFFIALNFTRGFSLRAPRVRPLLDLTFQPRATTEVVISMFNEPLDSISSLLSSLRAIPTFSNAHIHIYTKDPLANTTALQQYTGAQQITQLRNIGREGETYLHHILSQWDALAKHTLFVQASVHNQHDVLLRLRSYFDPQYTGMLSLGFVGHTSLCNGSDMWGWHEDSGIVADVYERVHKKPCEKVLLSYKGQFIVSAQRIRGIPKDIYFDLHRALVDEHSWAHREPYLQGRADVMSAPVFGYTLERLWNTIFQCSNMEVAWRCPSLLSRSRYRGDRSDCQCVDSQT
ncbi:hypothetical protein J1614_009485 [Plenodomus biglobosus]|nr:hypothetical protein J1614_009485 [Plenodomus biglobosus]